MPQQTAGSDSFGDFELSGFSPLLACIDRRHRLGEGKKTSMKWCIQAGYFRDDYSVAKLLDRAAVDAILERFADRGDDGQPVAGRQPRHQSWEVLGYVEREMVLLRATGVAEINIVGSGPRLNGFLAALCRELGCRLLDANNGGWVTDLFLDLAVRHQAVESCRQVD